MYNIKMKLNLKNYFLNNPNKSSSSVINTPILKDKKVVGIITDYDIDTDEATGCIYEEDIIETMSHGRISDVQKEFY